FQETVDTKYVIFEHLDRVTRRLAYKLDYFVIFSSLSCGKGNGGQANYGLGNARCERLCEQRQRDGLHALSIQYGAIGDVGALSEKDQAVQLSNLRKQRINSVLDVLDKLLAVNKTIVTSFVRAERIMQSGSRQKRMVKELWRALGIDPDTTPDHLTLGEIGLESMFAVELQQELEREWNIKMSINHVKNITVKMLKDYESGRMEDFKRYVDEVKTAKANLLKCKFVIPLEKYTRLNKVTTGQPIYFLPAIEGSFKSFEELAVRFDRPVIGLNWTRDLDSCETIKEINRYFSDLLKTVQPRGQYDVVGYFDFALTAGKLLRRNQQIDRAVIIDILSETQFSDDVVTDEFLLEFIFMFVSNEIPQSFRDKIFRDMKCEPNIDARIRRACNEIRDFAGKGLVAPDLEEILRNSLKRAKLLAAHRCHKKSKLAQMSAKWATKWAKSTGKLIVVKPFEFSRIDDEDEFLDRTRDLYFLPNNESCDTIKYEKVDEYSLAIASEKIGEKLLDILNE
ncbi:unnamed protein product, partial [Medioppia subpectinata]